VGNTLAVDRSGDDVVLNWTRPPEDAGHDPARFFPVHRSDDPSGGFVEVGEPTECCMHDLDAGAAPGQAVYYLVSARNAAGDSGESPAP
jgi:hypothetical protein